MSEATPQEADKLIESTSQVFFAVFQAVLRDASEAVTFATEGHEHLSIESLLGFKALPEGLSPGTLVAVGAFDIMKRLEPTAIYEYPPNQIIPFYEKKAAGLVDSTRPSIRTLASVLCYAVFAEYDNGKNEDVAPQMPRNIAARLAEAKMSENLLTTPSLKEHLQVIQQAGNTCSSPYQFERFLDAMEYYQSQFNGET